jgi:hypothetical protein
MAEAGGVELLGPDGLLSQVTRAVLERASPGEMIGHLAHEMHDPTGGGPGNSRERTPPPRTAPPRRLISAVESSISLNSSVMVPVGSLTMPTIIVEWCRRAVKAVLRRLGRGEVSCSGCGATTSAPSAVAPAQPEPAQPAAAVARSRPASLALLRTGNPCVTVIWLLPKSRTESDGIAV